MSVAHEYVVLYGRSADSFHRNLLPRTDAQLDNYKNPDNDERGVWTRGSLIRREGDYHYAVKRRDGVDVLPPKGSSWRVPPKTMSKLHDEGRLWWGKDGLGELPFAKKFLSEVQDGVVPSTWWDYEFAGSTRNAKAELKALFAEGAPFDTPKPTKLIRRLLEVTTVENDLVLDFFAGSGTSGDAVWRQNHHDSKSRRFILVQLPEPTGRTDLKTIAAIARERLRRARAVLDFQGQLLAPNASRPADTGFRALRLDRSNFREWSASSTDIRGLAVQLPLSAESLHGDAADEATLYELLLKAGLPLTSKIGKATVAAAEVHLVERGTLVVCLAKHVTAELVDGLIALDPQPIRVICLDAAFEGNDQLLTNTVLQMKAANIVFKTV